MEIIEKYPNKPWDWNSISRNPNITMMMIEKYPNKPWNWECISMNPNLTIEMIEKYPNKNWDWVDISNNPNITYYSITNQSHKPILNNIILNKKYQTNMKILKQKEQLLRFRRMIKN